MPYADAKQRRAYQRIRYAEASSSPVRSYTRTEELYDVGSYVDEWVFLSQAGVRAVYIIEHSNPSERWFTENVLPRVSLSICSNCGNDFNPMLTGTLQRCSKTCGIRHTVSRDLTVEDS